MRYQRTVGERSTSLVAIADNAPVSKLFVFLVLITACTFDTDTQSVDTRSPDAEPSFGTMADAGAMNPDSTSEGQLDSGAAVDAAVDTAPATCDSIYGAATNFDLCEATPTSCRFYVLTNEDSCTNLCASFGGACIDNYDGSCASAIGSQGCNVVHLDQVCICTLP